ncbi:hypothetical protein GUITHDRAFT_134615 [Guillardia theta CCMP2712]|uniref:Uncharacterized protein n=1 Tax=Guillardia theta (strain CCMP2712) TaxID=905079 RepID=L1JSC8_GUITC|nr:hypothetical protein GUITHDRAFT_134615 [Guillardia theta CCMP2712]EKX51095.1 hypothetical protein GUITHDRAFT_134615 [Guillardia theta CCMP2712]|eukprot:XP_005838075.1 hypothetical protein GUITHDRAFT_134615 [Guillardia theta CCMP2712]
MRISTSYGTRSYDAFQDQLEGVRPKTTIHPSRKSRMAFISAFQYDSNDSYSVPSWVTPRKIKTAQPATRPRTIPSAHPEHKISLEVVTVPSQLSPRRPITRAHLKGGKSIDDKVFEYTEVPERSLEQVLSSESTPYEIRETLKVRALWVSSPRRVVSEFVSIE